MKQKFPTILFWSVLLCLLSIDCVSQNEEMPEPKTAPPPPGLVVPIDSKIALLATAGALLGVYVLRSKNI